MRDRGSNRERNKVIEENDRARGRGGDRWRKERDKVGDMDQEKKRGTK